MAARASNWCDEEIEVLVDQCSGKSLGEMNVFLGEKVTERVNSVGTCARPPKKVKKKWSDIKSATKAKAMAIKSLVVKTGGGPPPKPLSALHEKVLSVLPDCITVGVSGGIDTFLTIGMMHSGLGMNQVSSFMSAIEVPSFHHKTMKCIERKVGKHVRAVAKESCTEALQQKKAATLSETSSSAIELDQTANGQFKYGMGWQKRGSGKSYDSKSGVGTLIGNRTGKVCAYGGRIKDCKTCNYHKGKGSVPKHQCFKNWNGSSKAMEADVGYELVKEVEKENVNVSVMIMDDDSITLARIRQELSHSAEKWSDQNHTVKHFGNSLYSLQKKHKALSTKVIRHVQKCFNYALAQNKGNEEDFKAALSQTVPHLFGDHQSCGQWCGYHKDHQCYKHKGLPYGRPLTGDSLRADMDSIFSVFIANAEKIAPGGSTKDVESFNNMVATKAPKRIHLSGSDSLSNRVACAVSQKNDGHSYINTLNTSLGMSPGWLMGERASKLAELKRRNETENTIEFKKRRLERKLLQRKYTVSSESREGVTYQSGIAASHVSNDSQIPIPVTNPDCEKLPCDILRDAKKVFCDIETSSLHGDADIIQIAAVCDKSEFKKYITPSKAISTSASAVTQLTSYGNVLFYQGKPVSSVDLVDGLRSFISWLESQKPCILIGHNFNKFDFPRIIKAFEMSGFTESLETTVVGTVDTYPLLKRMFPKLESYSHEHIVSVFVQERYEAHNVLNDVLSLQNLCNVVGVSVEQLSTSIARSHGA